LAIQFCVVTIEENKMKAKMRMGVSAIWALCAILLFISTDSNAMPNFARKYDKNCAMCHTQVPKLNRTGFAFRLAGYRMPDEIGQDEKPNLGELFAARIQMQQENKSHTDVAPGKNTSTDQLTFFEATLYPLTGSWGGNFGSLTELSMASGEGFEIENAYVRGVSGDATSGWWSGKIGVMHPQEGFGASDRPLGNNRPLMQKQPSTGNPFYLWNIDEMAAEVGYYWPTTGTNLSARMSNGVIWKGDPKSGTDHADPAQGGALTKNQNAPGANQKNWQIVLNQYVNDDSGFTLYYYKGVIPFGDTSVPQTYTLNTFSRLAVYANWFVMPKKLNLLAGWLTGNDTLDDPSMTGTILGVNGGPDTTVNGADVGKSGGYYVEADYHVDNKLAFGIRHDVFDPSENIAHNTQTANSIFVNYQPVTNVQLIADLVRKTTEAGATAGDNTDNQFVGRLIFIF
jgi:hypothetical protein